MTLKEAINKSVKEILKKNGIKDIIKNISKNLDGFDANTLDILDAHVETQFLQMNKMLAMLETTGSKVLVGGTPDNNTLIEYNSEILSFDNSAQHKSAQKKRISYGLISLLIILLITTMILYVFLQTAIEDTIGADQIGPIVQKLMRLDSSAIINIVTQATTTQFKVAKDDMKFYASVIKSGDIMNGLYNMFQSSDIDQQLNAVRNNVQKIMYTARWFQFSVVTTAGLALQIIKTDGPAALEYIKKTNPIKQRIVDGRADISDNKPKKIKSKKNTTSGGNKRKNNKTKKNKTKKNKTKKNKTKKN
jgi:hypothetical protein